MSTALRILPRELLYALVGLAALLVVAVVLGFTNAFAFLATAVSAGASLVVLYLFYRFVVAVERIARAAERLADDDLGRD